MDKKKIESKIYPILKKIPKGKAITYKHLGIALGNKKLARVIGNILHKNKKTEIIPCYKVIKSDGKVGNYNLGRREKERRLKKEGIKIVNGKVQPEFLLTT